MKEKKEMFFILLKKHDGKIKMKNEIDLLMFHRSGLYENMHLRPKKQKEEREIRKEKINAFLKEKKGL